VAIRTFKVGLPMNHDLRKSLTMKPTRSMCQLMNCIDEHKRVEEDQLQGNGNTKIFPPEKRDPQPDEYSIIGLGETSPINLRELTPR